ncbi:ATP-dependent Clp protease adapter ClpS [Methylophilaceae bacterium]|jgi:ATP-dependent Clp protease adaptor protein ClpS|nr:ATP-dependent Clp protease adapter ClpS [Methylophilaceae bacterium]MDC1173227.1 ATP-dependent Clp protease adapter ClpS [Methylophilaceae bacterium]|tara:strand:+ start:1146 stop:1457 length:312 start_codon:yes stop_codon:yes gene_type:complete
MTSVKDKKDIKIAPEQIKPKLPSIYKVIILNDDYTPMEFVVFAIQKVFNKSLDEATRIMLKIHKEGIGIGGMYPLEIAETKKNQVLNLAKEASHPLQCIIEKI